MDTLFDVFCECAELNPDPIESEGDILVLQIGNQMLLLCKIYLYYVSYFIYICNYYSGEEEHNWIFSADQMVTNGAGSINSFGHLVYILFCYIVVTNTIVSYFWIIEVDDSEWNDVLAPTSSIGYSNGDHDLTHTVLQVIYLFAHFFLIAAACVILRLPLFAPFILIFFIIPSYQFLGLNSSFWDLSFIYD